MSPDGDNDALKWGPFGRPLFDDPEARALSRVGVVDVGSNSVRLVVFDGAARSPAYFFNEKVLCSLGRDLALTGRLHPEGRTRALSALVRFQRLAEGLGLPGLTAVATAAVRDAEDGSEFCAEVEAACGLTIHVIPGTDEARYSAQGVLLGWPGAYGLVCDIGGASMELAEISDGQVGRCVSSDLGPLKLSGLAGGGKARRAHIKRTVAGMRAHMGAQRDRLFLVGGSWRAFAKLDMLRRDYPLHVLHEYRMTARDVRQTIKMISGHKDHEALRAEAGVSANRMALLPLASDVLSEVIATFKPKDIAVSAYGIREGMLYQQMPDRLRARDPLIEACRFAEAKDARLPGFGRQLNAFLEPLMPGLGQTPARLVKAACLLHDVNWRAHPDYRAQVCFETATRANLGGLKHAERVFLGLSLHYRYTNRAVSGPYQPLVALLSESERRNAEVLGKAMRFGAMLWIKTDRTAGTFRYFPRKKILELSLSREAEPLLGEVARARLDALAEAMGATAHVGSAQ